MAKGLCSMGNPSFEVSVGLKSFLMKISEKSEEKFEEFGLSNTFLLKLSMLGTVLMLYGGMNHLRKHPESRNFILKRLSPKNQQRFMDMVAPKSAMNMEAVKTDLKKIRGVDENCMNGGPDCNRFADKPQLEEKFKGAAAGDNPLGKAAKQLIQVEKARFEQFEKIDKLSE